MRLKPRTLFSTNVQHIGKLVALDQKSVSRPLTMSTFSKLLGKPKIHGIGVFDENERLRGYVIYDSAETNRLSVVSLVVDRDFLRIGIGSGLLDCVRCAMNSIGESARFICHVSEEDSAAVKFLASYGKSRNLSTRTSLIRGEPRDVYSFVFQEERSSVCV